MPESDKVSLDIRVENANRLTDAGEVDVREHVAKLSKPWEVAIRRSYLSSVGGEEYAAKATPKNVARAASYFEGSGYELDSIEESYGEIQLLLDFLAFTKGQEED
jgi:hypothetical protein